MLYHPKALKRLSTHSGRLERWLGAERLEQLSNSFRHGGGPGVPWYGPPVNLADVPGSVWIGGDGDFVGDLGRGFFASAADSLADHFRRLWREAGKPVYLNEAQFGVGFTDIPDLITRMRTGYKQNLFIAKSISGAVTRPTESWLRTGLPEPGVAASAAPGGRAPTKATQGSMQFNNPDSGTMHLIGADLSCEIINRSMLLVDRIFDVAKTMNSTATEAVTGVPTRYQSATATADDYAGGNFLYMYATTAMAATAHNWTVCTYNNQAGGASTLPSFVGNGTGSAADVFDNSDDQMWFCPLATGDFGIKALTQMQCSALVATGTLDFVIAHPIGVMMFPQISDLIPFDWATMRNQAPRVFNDACLSLIKISVAGGSSVINGTITLVNAP
jgi:hypothetical protein